MRAGQSVALVNFVGCGTFACCTIECACQAALSFESACQAGLSDQALTLLVVAHSAREHG